MRTFALLINAAVGLTAGAIFAMVGFAPNDPQPILLLAAACASALVLFNELALRSDARRRVLKNRRTERQTRPRIPQTTKPFAERLHSYTSLSPDDSPQAERTESRMTYWFNPDLVSTTSTPPKPSWFIRSILDRIRAILHRSLRDQNGG